MVYERKIIVMTKRIAVTSLPPGIRKAKVACKTWTIGCLYLNNARNNSATMLGIVNVNSS